MAIGELLVKIGADARAFTRGLNDSTKQANKWAKQTERSIGPVMDGIGRAMMFVGAAGVAAFGAATAGSIKGASALEQYRNTLNVVMKDQEKAAQTMAWAVDFANKTPFETASVVDATVKLESYGLTAQKVLPAVGDMAAVMNKDIIQAVEAVADAQTGELERLKEFGITKKMIVEHANKTMRDIQIVNNQGQITDQENFNKALFSLMEDRFAGGMETQASSLKGLWSTVVGVMGTTLATMAGISATGEVVAGGLFESIKNKIKEVVDALGRWQEDGTLQEWADQARKAMSQFWNVASAVFNGLIAVGRWIIDHWGLIAPILAGVLAGFLAYRTVQAVIAAVTVAQMALNLVMTRNPIGLLVMAIAALVTAGVHLYRNWDTIKAKASELWSRIAESFNKIKQVVFVTGVQIVQGLWNGIKSWAGRLYDGVKSFVADNIVGPIKNLLGIASPSKLMIEYGEAVANGMAEGIRKASSKVKAEALGMIQGMIEQVQGITEQFKSNVSQAMEQFRQQEAQLTQEYQQQLDARTGALYGWIGIFDAVPEKMQVTGQELLANLKEQVKEFTSWQNAIAALASKAVDEGLIAELRQMGPKALPQIQALSSMSEGKLEEYVELWRQKHELARGQAGTELDALKTETYAKIEALRTDTNTQLTKYAVEFLKKIQEIRSGTLTRMQEMANRGVAIGSDLMTNLIRGIVNKKDDLARQLESVASMLSILPGGGMPTIQGTAGISIPAMASGGIVTSPTLALLGEAGPEAVVPLRGGNRMFGGALTFHIYDARDPDRVVELVVDRIREATGVNF